MQTTKIEAQAFKTGRKYLESRGYTELFPPRIVRASGACENIDTLFEVSSQNDSRWWIDRATGNRLPAYLAQTAQLYLEAHVPEFGRVYCTGPSFRAEPDIDGRHLSEFTMIEIEFAGNFEDLLCEIEGFIKTIQTKIYEVAGFPHLFPNKHDFARLTYDEAIKKLRVMGEEIEWGDDISSKREQILIKETGNGPLFITHFPDPMFNHGKKIGVEKFFNMLPDPERPGRVQSCDLILPVAGESVGAAARVHKPGVMRERLINSRMFKRFLERGGGIEDFRWYLDWIEKYGSVPHAGCGFGMARIIQWLQGVDDITKSITFPCHRACLI